MNYPWKRKIIQIAKRFEEMDISKQSYLNHWTNGDKTGYSGCLIQYK